MELVKYYVIEIMTYSGDISFFYCPAFSEKEARTEAISYAKKHEVHFKSVYLMRKRTKIYPTLVRTTESKGV